MNKLTKKEIRLSIEDAIKQSLQKFEISIPSKKTQKLLENSSRRIAEQIKDELKKKLNKAAKKVKPAKMSKKQALSQKVA
jgi:hypothetical protein